MVLHQHWHCHPAPDHHLLRPDGFGNPVLWLQHQAITGPPGGQPILRLEAELQVFLQPQPLPVRSGEADLFLGASTCCDVVLPVSGDRTGIDLVRDIGTAVYRVLEYRAGETDVTRPASVALRQGKAVCQDFAHLMIGTCRQRGLPARYVCGYATQPGPLHAWVEVLVEGIWLAWDPTIPGPLDPRSIAVACGRDYADVPPHRGRYQGQRGAELRSWCRMTMADQG